MCSLSAPCGWRLNAKDTKTNSDEHSAFNMNRLHRHLSLHLKYKTTFMKQLLGAIVIASALFTMPSCKDMEENDGKTVILYDSISTVLPTTQAIRAHVDDDKTRMRVVVGDLNFYNATPAEKTKKAEELGKMILRIYGPNNLLEKGSLTVTKNIRNSEDEPKDGITVPIDFEGLKKAGK